MARICVATNVFAEVDDADWVEVMNVNGNWTYRTRYVKTRNLKTRKEVFLHKLIYSFIDPTYTGQVDHRDRNRLNCKRDNFRPATCEENNRNVGLRITNTSEMTGVRWRSDKNKWIASIRVGDGKRINLGSFDSEIEAYQIRREAEIRYHKEFRPGD